MSLAESVLYAHLVGCDNPVSPPSEVADDALNLFQLGVLKKQALEHQL